MPEFHWAVDRQTGQFVRGGIFPYDPRPLLDGEIHVVTTDRNPHQRLERYSGDPANPIRLATSEEIAAADVRELARQDATSLDGRVDLITTMAWAFELVNGRLPTRVEARSAMARWKKLRAFVREQLEGER